MTKEIALHCMKSASELERELCEECPIYGQTGCDHCYEDALQYVIGMLEQDTVLEQIRAEISAILTNSYDEGVKEKALQIIDKYRGIRNDKGNSVALYEVSK